MGRGFNFLTPINWDASRSVRVTVGTSAWHGGWWIGLLLEIYLFELLKRHIWMFDVKPNTETGYVKIIGAQSMARSHGKSPVMSTWKFWHEGAHRMLAMALVIGIHVPRTMMLEGTIRGMRYTNNIKSLYLQGSLGTWSPTRSISPCSLVLIPEISIVIDGLFCRDALWVTLAVTSDLGFTVKV